MPTNDHPAPRARTPRRALGRGPGTAPPAAGAAAPPQRVPAADDGDVRGPEPATAAAGAPPTADPAPATEPAPAEPAPATEPALAEPAGADTPAVGRQARSRTAPRAGEEPRGGVAPGNEPTGAASADPEAEADDADAAPLGASGELRAGEELAGVGASAEAAPRSRVADAGSAAQKTAAEPAAEPGRRTDGAADGGVPSVPVGEASGSEEASGKFTVRLANFEGPFDLLLQLIAKHKLDVTEVALSKVTDEFMAHIRAMGPDWDLDQTTEFLVVAATLLDLKAARLLPAAEVEDEADLALLEARDLLFARLLQYRAYKQVADIFSERLLAEARRHPRTVGLEPHHAELLPEVVISIGPEGFAKLAVKAMQPKPKPQVYVDHIHAPLVSVREQAEVVIARLREAGEVSFQALTEDAPDTLTVVARFLALLELYRERAVALDQHDALGPLLVRWTGAADGERPVVTDEFDQTPEQRAAEAARKDKEKETA